MALVTPIPNQYAKQGELFTYTFPAGTFSGAPTFTAFCNRLLIGRELPEWLTFTDNGDGTGTFSGTPTEWFHCRILQLVVEADVAGVKSYCIFILCVGESANTGTIPWRAGDTPEFDLTLANIGSFNSANVQAGDWVAIGPDITKSALPQSYLDKINGARANGGRIVWKWRNENGLKAHEQNYFNFELVNAGETIAIDFSLGNTRAFNPLGKLKNGLPGKHIFVTNYDAPGFILSRNYADNQNTSAIRFSRTGETDEDRYITVFGQPNNHTPFVNLYGIGIKEGLASQINGPRGHIEHSYVQASDCTIAFHWKPNTTLTGGDRRPSENVNGWDMNQKNTKILDCFAQGVTHEVIYLGGGGWQGGPIQSKHTNPDGSPKMITVNGNQVQEYHNIQRFNSIHEEVCIEHNIFLGAGWDPIQTRCVTRKSRVMYNYCFEAAQDPSVNTVQGEGIITDGSVGEVAYNWIERSYFSGLRGGQIGMDSFHHNIVIDVGQGSFGNPGLNAPQAGTGMYVTNRDLITSDIPTKYIQSYPTWSSTTVYPIDNQVTKTKVKYNGKSYRSKAAGNQGNNPETSPDWWEDTREWVPFIAYPELTEADLFVKIYNNTFVNCKTNTLSMGHALTGAKRFIKNNLFVNCGSTVVSGGSGSNTSNNIAVVGAALSAYFQDAATKDFRLAATSPAIGAGADLTAELTGEGAFTDGFKDFSGQPHVAIPSVGAFEEGSPIGSHYGFAINGHFADGGGTSNPPPLIINAGADRSLILPVESLTITAVKENDDGRVISSILWEQLSGPNTLTINNETALAATFLGFVAGVYVVRITTVDEYNQTVTDSVTINVSQTSTYSSFIWYVADDVAGSPDVDNKNVVAGVTTKSYTPPAGQNKWYARAERPVSQSGTLLGSESLSNWVNVP